MNENFSNFFKGRDAPVNRTSGSIVFDNLALLLAMGVFGEIIMKKQSLLTAR